MTDDATQKTDRAAGAEACEIHGWESGDFFGTVLIPSRDCRVFGTLRVCTDCIGRMGESERHHFLSFIGVSVANFAMAPVSPSVPTPPADDECDVHGFEDGKIGEALARAHFKRVPLPVRICGECLERLPHPQITIKEKQHGTET